MEAANPRPWGSSPLPDPPSHRGNLATYCSLPLIRPPSEVAGGPCPPLAAYTSAPTRG